MRAVSLVAIAAAMGSIAGCAEPKPDSADMQSAMDTCKIPKGALSATVDAKGIVTVKAIRPEALSYKDFQCFFTWAQDHGLTNKIGVMTEEL